MFNQVFHTDIRARAVATEVGRLLDRWEESARRLDGPRFEDLEPAACSFAAGNLIILEPTPDRSFYYRYFGSNVAAAYGRDMTGRHTNALPAAVTGILESRYRQALDSFQPMLIVHRSSYTPYFHLWERLILPVRVAGGEPCLVVFAKPRETERDFLRAILEASPEAIAAIQAVRDDEGRLVDAMITHLNRRAVEITGLSAEAMVDHRLLELFPDLVPTGVWARYAAVIETRVPDQFEVFLPRDGVDRWLRLSVAPLGDGFVLAYNDVTQSKRILDEANRARLEAERARLDLAQEIEMRRDLEVELRRMATIDGLTGALNRRGFEEVSRRAAAAALRYDQPLSLIVLDIDHFKRVNDLHGHGVGDTVLTHLTGLISREMRKDTDALARIGGEEFVVLLPNTPVEGARVLAERLRRRVASTQIPAGPETIAVTASFGVQSLADGGDAERMLIEADQALYAAKRTGRNRVVVHGDDDDGSVAAR